MSGPSTATHEQTINTALGEVLQDLGRSWRIRSENVGRVFEEGGRPDVLIEKADGWPIVIEAEVTDERQAEIEAQDRLGCRVVGGSEVHAALALVYPVELRAYQGASLREAIKKSTFKFALFTTGEEQRILRFPSAGWLDGGIADLALLLHRSSVPSWRVELLAESLERGVERAAGILASGHPPGSPLGQEVATILGQADDDQGQTRRMAMTVVADALVFHAALSETGLQVPDNPPRLVRSPSALRSGGRFLPSQVADEWELILKVNYWPIFFASGQIVRALPPSTASSVLNALWRTAEQLVVGGVTRSHDLTGIVFQRLIADRKFLATFYTRPAAAAMLAGLAVQIHSPLAGDDWGDAESVSSLRIGDFACGTGTLLSTAYHRVGVLHETHGGDQKALHPRMMEQGLVGLDVLNVAVHLTAAMLAGTYPDTPFAGECLLTMPYGSYSWGVCVGSLDLLKRQTLIDAVEVAAESAGGRGTEEVRSLIQLVGDEQFDLVIMNPPFARHGAREGDRTHVHNPAFAAFGAQEEEQNLLSSHLSTLAAGGAGHGHAGMASHFTDLANRKVADGGTLALVLPSTSMSGASWEKARKLIRRNYESLVVVTIAARGSHTRSFSADTGMAECLIVGRKRRKADSSRAAFVVLAQQPSDSLEGEQIAQAITLTLTDPIRRLEAGPFGGTRILTGSVLQGEALDCPLPTDGPWQVVGIQDLTLAQTASQLAEGTLWVEGMAKSDVERIPVTIVKETAERVGPHDLDLYGPKVKTDGLPQGPFEIHPGYRPSEAYPCLWNHKSTRERSLFVQPDCHCQLREVDGRTPDALVERAERRWATAARSHYNVDLRFNSQSLVVATTPMPSIGGRAWPTVVLSEPAHEPAFALWCNSTLGLLCHWWVANKRQAGRGSVTRTNISRVPTLDLRCLSADQIGRAEQVLHTLARERFLPFDQIGEDAARARLDEALIVNVLGLPRSLCNPDGPMDRLRQKLAAEPQIRGDKKTRVVFTSEGESTKPRS